MRHCDTLLHAACIVTQDEQRRVIEKASLAIDKGLVAAVGPTAEITRNWQADNTKQRPSRAMCRTVGTHVSRSSTVTAQYNSILLAYIAVRSSGM